MLRAASEASAIGQVQDWADGVLSMGLNCKVSGWSRSFSLVCVLCLLTLAGGCAVSTKVTSTPRSTTEQQLLVRSLERAMAQMDAGRFAGKSVTLDVHGLTGDRNFAKEWVVVWLREHGAQVVSDPEKSDLQVKMFLSAFGVDRGEVFAGVPAFGVPIIGMPVPEIALFKSVQNRGLAESQVHAFDRNEGTLTGKSPTSMGRAKYDEYTILIIINFALSDIDQRPEQEKDEKS